MADNVLEAGLPRLRTGLVVMPDGETGRGRVVKDPRTRRYYRFDEVEGFILDRLDGRNTAVDVQVELAAQLGETFTLEEVQDFLDTLKEKGLVEDGAPLLPVSAPEFGQQIALSLEQSGLAQPVTGLEVVLGQPGAFRADEAAKFEEALDCLRSGRIAAALRAFDEILAANPANTRAAAIRQMLLQIGAAAALSAAEQQSAPAKKQSKLYYRIPLFAPDRLMERVQPWLSFVWTRGFLVIWGLVVAAGAAVGVTHAREIAHVPQLPGGIWALAFFLSATLLVCMHEWSHGLTCKRFGGKIPELGFLVIFFFMPAMYVDVSDAWLFRKRGQRVLVGLAGPMFDLFAAASSVLVWRTLAPGWGRVVALTLMTTASASFLMNLNPLIKLDGYYILSDLSGIPNLRAAAGRAFRRLFRRGGESAPLPAGTRGFLAVYGLLSTLYSVVLLGVLLRVLLGLSTSVAGLWGPAVIVVTGVWFSRRMWAALAARVAAFLGGMNVARAASIGAAAALLGAAILLPLPLKVGGPAQLEARVRGGVRPSVGGNLAEILVHEGDRVEAGQVVARLDTRDLTAQLAMTRAAVARAQAEAALVARGPEREQITQVREKARAARLEVDQLAARHDRLTKLRREGLVAADQFDQSTKELLVSEGALRAATEEARLVERGSRPEQIIAAQSDVQRYAAEAQEIERRIAAAELRAPAAGIVVTPALDTRRGDYVAPGGLVLEIADTRSLAAQVDVLESEIGDVAKGRPVVLRFAAFPDRAFTGQVEDIAPAARADALGRAAFRVRCAVTDGDGVLRPGMTGAAKIACGRRTLGQIVVRRVIRMIDPSLL